MSTLQGPILMVAAMAGFAAQDAVIKAVATGVPAGQIGLVLGIGGALVFWVLLRRKGQGLFVASAFRGAALVRNLAEVGAAMSMILSVAMVPLSVVSAILQAMPLTVTLGAALFLGEPVGWRRWSAILIGFVGVMLILRPGSASFDILALLPLAAVMFLSTRDIATKRVGNHVTSLQLSGWGFVAVIPGGVILLFAQDQSLVMPNLTESTLLFLTIVFGIGGYTALVLATRAGAIAVTTPFRYSRLVFAMIIGIVIFGERPDMWTYAGSALIVVAGLYAMMREIRIKRV